MKLKNIFKKFKGELKIMSVLDYCAIKGNMVYLNTVEMGEPLKTATQAKTWLAELVGELPEIAKLYMLTDNEKCYYIDTTEHRVVSIKKADVDVIFAEEELVEEKEMLVPEPEPEIEEPAVEPVVEEKPPEELVVEETQTVEKEVELKELVYVAPDDEKLKDIVKQALNEMLADIIAKLKI